MVDLHKKTTHRLQKTIQSAQMIVFEYFQGRKSEEIITGIVTIIGYNPLSHSKALQRHNGDTLAR